MNSSVVIKGIGLVTPLGVGADATWQSLLAGAFIASHARCEAVTEAREPEAIRVDRLAVLAAREAIAAANWSRSTAADDRTAVVAATSRGAADHWLEADPHAGPTAPPTDSCPSDNPAGRSRPSFGLSSVADAVAIAVGHGFGPRLTLSGACASGLHALIRATMLLQHGDADRAIVVAAESSLHPLFLQSFRRLGVLPPDGGRCRPFDVNRAGFLCAEAAAAIVLERVDAPAATDVRVDRYAFAGDAAHLTGFDASGATLRRLLAAALDGRAVDVIHAHGTGTETNDAAEAAAIDAVLAELPAAVRPPTPPSVYSHKGAIGHTVGAAGLVSVALNALMHRHGVVPPNVGVETPIEVRRATIARGAVDRPVRRSVACAAGFGGATAAVSLASD